MFGGTRHQAGSVMAVTALVLMTGCDSCDDAALTVLCPETCYTGPEGTEGVGACTGGVPICDGDGNVVECEGEIVPENERGCDTIDADCDGDVNDSPSIQPDNWDNQCLQCGRCRRTWERCDGETGQWYCDYQQGPPTPEVCDGQFEDEDCDCLVDGQDPDLPSPDTAGAELEFCYTGPDGTALEGACRPGYRFCDPVTGEWGCSDITPKPEDCSGTDRDCNGFINDVDLLYDFVAMVLAIDISGSMGNEVDAVKNVICDYANQGANESFLFGLVLIAFPDGHFSLVQNLTDAETLCEALQDVVLSGGDEPTLSTAEAVVDPNNPLLIAWPENAKRIFVGFGDEPAAVVTQGDLIPQPVTSVGETIANTLAYCAASETDVYWFVQEPWYYAQQAEGCNGHVFQLTSYEPWMLEDMNTIVESVCLEQEDLDGGVIP